MGWQVEDYSIELDDSDRSLLRIIYANQVGWTRPTEDLNIKHSIRFLDHYFKLYTGGLHFTKSVNRFCEIIEECESTLLVDSFHSYMVEMSGEKIRKGLSKEKMLLVIRLWMIHQEMLDDEILTKISLVDFMFSILNNPLESYPTIIKENIIDFDCFIKHYVLN